jgi:dolichyl-phosphate-mannose--protein O-mannosyl transferase
VGYRLHGQVKQPNSHDSVSDNGVGLDSFFGLRRFHSYGIVSHGLFFLMLILYGPAIMPSASCSCSTRWPVLVTFRVLLTIYIMQLFLLHECSLSSTSFSSSTAAASPSLV